MWCTSVFLAFVIGLNDRYSHIKYFIKFYN
nr:MAG TPA: hypothetical protein [Caudoviricetes sp.]